MGKSEDKVLPYMANVMMKVNLKGGGRNYSAADNDGKNKISDVLSKTFVLGADVTHSGAGSLIGCPSIAAVVGSTGPDQGQ